MADTMALTDGGFFVFGDLSVRMEGRFRLRFNLFEMMQYGLLRACETFLRN